MLHTADYLLWQILSYVSGFPKNYRKITYEEIPYVLEQDNIGISSRDVVTNFQEVTVQDTQIQRILNYLRFLYFVLSWMLSCLIWKYRWCIYNLHLYFQILRLVKFVSLILYLLFFDVNKFNPILSMLCFVQFKRVVQEYQRKRRLRLNYKVRCFVFQAIWHFRVKWCLGLGPHKLCSYVT